MIELVYRNLTVTVSQHLPCNRRHHLLSCGWMDSEAERGCCQWWWLRAGDRAVWRPLRQQLLQHRGFPVSCNKQNHQQLPGKTDNFLTSVIFQSSTLTLNTSPSCAIYHACISTPQHQSAHRIGNAQLRSVQKIQLGPKILKNGMWDAVPIRQHF